MGKKLRDGIIVDNSFLLVDEKKSGIQIPARVFQFLAILIGSYSAFSVLVHGIKAPVNIIVPIIVCSCIMFILSVYGRFDLVKLFFGILFYGLFFFSRFPQLKNGFYLIENLVISQLYTSYQYSTYYFLADTSSVSADILLLLIMVMIPVIALFSIAIVRNRLINLCSVILFLPVAGSFLVGVIPSEKYLIAYFVAILYLVRAGIPYHHLKNKDQRTLFQRINNRAAVWMCLLALMIFFILKLFIPKEQYSELTQLNDMKTKVQNTFATVSIEDFSEKFTDIHLFEFEAASGGLKGGKLGNIGKVSYNGTIELSVTASKLSLRKGIYLKGYVGCEYKGDSWAGHSNEDKSRYELLQRSIPPSTFAPINQTNQLLKLAIQNPEIKWGKFLLKPESDMIYNNEAPDYSVYNGSMSVTYEEANKKFIYAPYYTDYGLLDQVSYMDDLYTAPGEQRGDYTFDYFYNVNPGESEDTLLQAIKNTEYAQNEYYYRNYVYDVYTRLPEKGLSRLKKDFYKNNDSIRNMSLKQKMDYVMDYLSKNTQYTLEPGKLPKGKDFVEYFLYENRKGYCSHYASAAVLMLRDMGIPARYVEGYVIRDKKTMPTERNLSQFGTFYVDGNMFTQETDAENVTVHDYDAHAWVEVYMDGCGWIPMEFTPGSTISYNTAAIDEFSEGGRFVIKKDNRVQPSMAPLIPTQPAINQEQNKQNSLSQTPEDLKTEAERNAKLNIGFLIAFLLLSFTAAAVLIIILMRQRSRIRYEKNINKKVIYLYTVTEKLLNCVKGLPVRKARLEEYEEYIRENSRFTNPEQFHTFMETVKKARFGKDSINSMELKLVEEFYRQLYNKVYTELPIYKKLRIKLSYHL